VRIAVDARELTARPTGVGRYLSELLTCWSGAPPATRHEWRFFAHQRPSLPTGFDRFVDILPGAGGTAWEQWQLPRALSRWRPDVLFAPGYTSPLTAPSPTVLTIHDVSFCAHPEWFAPREGWRRRVLTKWSARRAKVVLTVSEFSRDEIVRHVGLPPQKIRVVRHGITRRPGIVRAPIAQTRERMILFVGSIFRRRHVDTLLTTFIDSVADRVPDSRLEIVGENRTHPPDDLSALVRASPAAVRSRITLRSYVTEEVLDDLYARASVFVFLSEYEGFGLTPLEALAAGVPPLVLDTPVAREVYGQAARFVQLPADQPMALADALVHLLSNQSARQAVLSHADAVLARYDWHRAAAATLAALEDAAGG
jgi:glycosyltransferase involved in cell wall biosynthesis